MISIRIVTTPAEFSACLAIRREVFMEEQSVPEADELDDRDPECVHFVADAGVAAETRWVGTARLCEWEDGKAKAQRVAVRAAERRQGTGRALMQALEAEAQRRGFGEIHLSAQVESIPFYEQLGYIAEGERYLDAGIWHRDMHKALGPARQPSARPAPESSP